MEQKISVKREMRAIPAEEHLVIDLTGFDFSHYGESVDISSVADPAKFESIQTAEQVPNIDVLVTMGGDSPHRLKLAYIDNLDQLVFIAPMLITDHNVGLNVGGFAILNIWSDGEETTASLAITEFNHLIDFGWEDLTRETTITDTFPLYLYNAVREYSPEAYGIIVQYAPDPESIKRITLTDYSIFNNAIYFFGLHVGDEGVDGMAYLKVYKSGSDIKGQSYIVPFGG